MESKFLTMVHNDPSSDTRQIKIDGVYANSIRLALSQEGIPEEGIEKIFQNASEILQYCANPVKIKEQRNTGIIIGKVQSGKTSNFISLASLAFDNNYRLVIILGGTKKALVKQNTQRLERYFKSKEDEIFILNSSEYKDQLTESNIIQFLNSEKKIILVLLKHPNEIGLYNSIAI